MLNAEQELLNSQVLLVTARRDAYVAGFQLLNVMGRPRPRISTSTAGRSTTRQVNYNRYAAQLVRLGRRAADHAGLDPHRAARCTARSQNPP